MHLLEELGDLDFDINVVSKSGTTLEPRSHSGCSAVCWRQSTARRRQKSTSSHDGRHRGVLKQMADEEGWETFVVPDDVGGRYSVLSAVGLLPMAASGIDVQTVIGEAIEASPP